MRKAILVFSLFTCTVPMLAGACEATSSAPLAEIRITQPVLATPDGDSTHSVRVAQDGCVQVHYPSWDTRAGSYAYRLDGDELRDLRAQLAATRINGFDPAKVRSDLERRDAQKRAQAAVRTEYRVTDEEVIELQFDDGSSKARVPSTLVWSGVRQQLLNHPDQTDLIGLSAARDLLLDLADDPRKRALARGADR
jgi:hypothetical protein